MWLESGEPVTGKTRPFSYLINLDEVAKTMKSRAELLAEIEEKRLQDNRLPQEVDVLSIEEPDVGSGYNPYDSPGRSKELPDGADITLRRQAAFRPKQRD